MAIQAVLFDLDGTLLETVPDLAAAVNAMLREMGRPEISQRQVGVYVGKGAESLVRRALSGSMDGQVDPDLFRQAMALWNQHYELLNGYKAHCFDGVREGLDMLQNAGFKLAVVTNKPERYTLPLLKRTELLPYFEVVVGGDTCARKKPDPMPIEFACQQLGVSPDEALMIGDSVNDALSARAAGVSCWLLPYGYNEGNDIHSTPCDAYVQTIEEAANLLLTEQGTTA